MYPILYKANETNFVHNGIGFLRDAITVYPEEELNGYSEITIEYDADGFLADEIKNGMIIKSKANDKQQPQLFRIYSHVKDHAADQIIINGRHITNDLADNFVEALEIRNLTLYQAMKAIQEAMAYPTRFNLSSTNTTTQSSTNIYRNNPLQMVAGTEGSILQIWGGQIERDNFDLIMHRRRGSDDGVKVLYKKNLTGLQATFDDDSVVTRIYPFKYVEETEEEPERLITIPGKYIDSPNIDKYPHIKILPIDASSEEGIENSTDLYNAYKDYFSNEGKDKDLPSISMEVEFEHLHETEEYKDVAALEHVGLGDTITVAHSKWGLDLKASIVKIEYDAIAEKNRKVSAGNVRANFTDSVNQNANDLGVIGDRMNNIDQKSNEAIRAANGKNTIYYGPDEPIGDNLIKGDIWFRIVDGEYTRTYIYDGVQWQLSIDMESKEAKETAAEARNRAQNAVDKANLATDNANEAIADAQKAFDKAQESLTKSNDASADAREAVEKSQSSFDKAEESMTRADSAFNKADALTTVVNKNTGDISSVTQIAQGLRTRVSDAEGNISTLQQTATSYGRRIKDAEDNVSSLIQTAEGLQTQVNDKADQSTVTQLAGVVDSKISKNQADGWYASQSQLTQTASSLQSTIKGVRDDLDGLEVGGRNLMLDSLNRVPGAYDGSNFNVDRNVTVEEWNADKAIRLYGNGGNSTVFATFHTGISGYRMKDGQSYVHSIFIKNNSANNRINVNNNRGTTETVYPNEIKRVVLHGTGNGTNYLQFTFSVSTPGLWFDFTYFQPQIEEGNKVTPWSPSYEDMATKSELTQTAEEFGVQISTAQGEISELKQTSSSLATRIGNAEGNISTLTQTAQGLQTRVQTAEGNISTVTQLANTLQSKLSDAEGNINELTQTSSSLQSTIKGVRDDLDGLEVGGTNLNEDSNNFSRSVLSSYDGAPFVIVEEKVAVEEWGATDATEIRMGAGDSTSLLKVYKSISSTTNTVLGETYTISFYVKNLRNDAPMSVNINGLSPRPTVNLAPNESKRVVVTGERATGGLQLQFRSNAPTMYTHFIVWRAQVEEGNKVTPWSPSYEDMATQSQISQLNNAINLRVEKGDVIHQINLDTSGAYIGGNKIVLDGNVTVLGAFRVDSGHITSLNAGKITTGTLDAGKLNVINVSANSIVSGLLQSQNSNTTFNLNSGDLTMSRATFTLGGGASIRFTDRYNSLTFNRENITAGVGFDVGTTGNPIVFTGSAYPSLNTNDYSFSGLIISSQHSQTNSGGWSSIVSRNFMFRDRTDYSKAIRIDLNSSNPRIVPSYTGNYNYDLGSSNNKWNTLHVNRIQGATVYVSNPVGQGGWAMETQPESGSISMTFRGINSGMNNFVYNLGSTANPFNFARINHLRPQSNSVSSSIGDSSNRYNYVYANSVFEGSDARIKDNITDAKLGLAFINDLHLVDYRLIESNQWKNGVIAQELEQTLSQHGVDMSRQSMVSTSDEVMSVSYNQLIAPTIRAVQELDTKVDSEVQKLEEIIERQAFEIADLKRRLHKLEVA